MKNFITVIACMLLLLSMIVSYGNEQMNHAKITFANKAIHNAKEIAKQDGYFTDANISELRTALADQFGVDEGEIIISATGITERKKRGELIHYSITIPMKNYIGAAAFWGISDSENVVEKKYDYYTTSEWIGV